MPAAVEILRPLNCIMAGAGVLAGAVIGAGGKLWVPGTSTMQPLLPAVLLAGLSAFLVTGAGNALNDWHDRRVDRVNHPDRPIPSGRMSPDSAYRYAKALFIMGLSLSAIAFLLGGSPGLVLIAAVNAGLLVGYESRWKREGASGNLIVAWLSASVFLYGGAAVGSYAAVAMLVLLAFLVSFGREIVKDIQDIAGDRGERTTLPMTWGQRRSSEVAASGFACATAFSLLPVLFRTFPMLPYLPVALVADGMFIMAAAVALTHPDRASRYAKAGMFIGLLAFLAGGLSS